LGGTYGRRLPSKKKKMDLLKRQGGWMKIALTIVFFAASALSQQKVRFGQHTAGPRPSACGPVQDSFKVKLDDSQHTLVSPEPGKARIYFIHDDGIPFTGLTSGYPTSKFAIDGVGVGADHGDSYFSTSVNPGERHLCATLQSSLVDGRTELAHLVVVAGNVYYYRTRLILSGSVELLELELIDSDQGQYLVGLYPLSVWKRKN
jgi:hypothetical protein